MEKISAVERARQFGIDLTIIYENLKLTPTQRIEQLERWLRFIDELRNARYIGKYHAGN